MATALHRLDERQTGYRFDLETDIPWSRLGERGVFFPDGLLVRLGFDLRALALTPGAREALDVTLALVVCKAFTHLEQDVVAFVDAEGAARPSRSAMLLVEEERKHIALFARLAAELAALHPEVSSAVEAVWSAPPSYDRLRARVAEYESADAVALTFWLHTLFFEEYTVFFQHALEEAAAGTVQPTWLAAHHAHRQEELQHVLTDAAYIDALAMEGDARRRLSKAFLFFIDDNCADLLGTTVACSALRALHPQVSGLPAAGTPLRALPLFVDVLNHRAFARTRAAAPYLTDLVGQGVSPTTERGVLTPPRAETLVDALAHAAGHARVDVTSVALDGSTVRWSAAQLWEQAEQRLAALQAHGARPGDAVIVMTAEAHETLPWFWACTLGGLLPALVALPTTAEDAEEVARLVRIHAQLRDPWVVVDAALADLVTALLPPGRPGRAHVIPADARGARSAHVHRRRGHDAAFLQFSSGSMGSPRGVVVTHANLFANIHGMLAARRARDDETFVSWMPLFHDMGLIGYHLTPIVAEARQVLLSPFAFMRDPLVWLRALTTFEGTITGGPTFALARVLARLTPEAVATFKLDALHTFLVGAEPVAEPVLRAFVTALGPAGLRGTALCPAYGLAEATLAVTMVPPGEEPRALTVRRDTLHRGQRIAVADADAADGLAVVDLGVPLAGLQVRVVDAHGAPLADDVVGAVEVKGTSVTPGYHGEPPRVGWLHTGDLGFVRAGRLFVTGREKDVFFVGGRNHYAHDVENVVRELPLVHAGGVALVVDWNARWGVDDLTLCVALKDDAGLAVDALRAVHAHVQRRLGVVLGSVLAIDKRTIPRTTSGKLMRRTLLAHVRSGAFAAAPAYRPPADGPAPASPVHEPADGALVDAVRGIWATVLALPLDAVPAEAEFRALGGTSLLAVQVHDRVEKLVGRALGPDVLAVGTTPARMAAFLARATATQLHGVPSARATPATEAPAVDDDAIAVVGLAVRAPGAESPAALWHMLDDRSTAFAPLAAERMEEAQLFGDEGLRAGAWFSRIDLFDAAHFGLSDAEARAMGPAQRLFLEVAAEALASTAAHGNTVGVFAAAGNDGTASRYADDPALVTGHTLLGALPNMVAARVARTLGLRGPALTVDTACSSSLTAVHLACASLRSGECAVAVAGGVSIGLTGDLLLSFQRAGLLSSSGACRPFDAHADGLVPGEAAAAVVLKPLRRAREDGDHVLALVLGSALNNDGGALSGTAPSPRGQTDVVTAAWRHAHRAPHDAAFVEAHAAGTAIGDALELAALAAAVGPRAQPLPVGSVKGNLGHTLAAAGIMGFAKAVLTLVHRRYPGTVGLESATGRVDVAAAQLSPSPRAVALGSGDLCAGVSSFGLGGTNVHVVLATPPARGAGAAPTRAPFVLCVGAQPGAFSETAGRLASRFDSSTASVADWVAACGGLAEQMPERRAALVTTRDEVRAALRELGQRAPTPVRGKVAFVFPGPGSQVAGMGRALFDAEPVFRAAVRRCAAILDPLGVDIEALLLTPSDDARAPVHQIALCQPAVFSFGYALACWWRHLGVEPALVIGHSAGELAALHVAGALSLNDALHLVTARGRAMAATAPGRMAAVLGPRAGLDALMAAARSKAPSVGVAAFNAPTQTVIAGTEADIAFCVADAAAHGVVVRPLDVDCAAHTPAMAEAAAAVHALAERVRFDAPTLPVVSTTTADVLKDPSAAHLAAHVTAPVQFERAIARARALGADVFLELGGTAGLSSCIRQVLDATGDDAAVVASGARDGHGLEAPRAATVALLNAGLPLHPSRVHTRPAQAAVDIVPVPYARRRLWVDRSPRTLAPRPASLLPQSVLPRMVLQWEQEPAIRDHQTAGVATAPAALLLDLLIDDVSPAQSALDLADVVVVRPLALTPGTPLGLQVVADAAEGGRTLLQSIALDASGATAAAAVTHLQARAVPARGRVHARLDVAAIGARLGAAIDGRRIYDRLDASGFVMGRTMQALARVRIGDGELLAELVSPEGASRGRRVDPALLDGASHAVAALFLHDDAAGMYLGFSLGRVRFHGRAKGACLAYVRLRDAVTARPAAVRYDITLMNADGDVLVEIEDFVAKRVAADPAPPAAPVTAVAAAGDASRAQLVQLVQTLVAVRLRRKPEQIGEHAALARLGVDSLMAVELVKKLEAALGMKLYVTLLFEATTVGEVATRLVQLRSAQRGHEP